MKVVGLRQVLPSALVLARRQALRPRTRGGLQRYRSFWAHLRDELLDRGRSHDRAGGERAAQRGRMRVADVTVRAVREGDVPGRGRRGLDTGCLVDTRAGQMKVVKRRV